MNSNAWMLNAASPELQGIGRLPLCAATGMPADLRDWVGELTLVNWVLEVVADLDARQLGPADRREGRTVPVPTMLSVMTYCYATGRYASEEIESLVRADRAVRYLAANQCLTSVAIGRARRDHRSFLRACLLGLHQRAWQLRFGTGPATIALPRGEADAGLDGRLAGAAEARIRRAVLCDTMAADV